MNTRDLARRARGYVWAAQRSRSVAPTGTSPSVSDLDAARAKLQDPYKAYTGSVSTPEMAVSLETASWLLAHCERTSPTRVIDLGSGFSSYVLRSYAAAHGGVEVTSVDDAADWLDKTKEFLRGHDLDDARVLHWDDLPHRGGYDLVFHDMGNLITRARTVHAAMSLAAPTGMVIVDDVQNLFLWGASGKAARHHNRRLYSLSAPTLDGFGRFAAAAVPR